MRKYDIILLFAIIGIAAAFRFTGLNWDANQHLHPDERFLTMVANGISWPSSITEYFDTTTSPLNPHNRNFSFYVYGTFPLFLVKAIAEALGRGDYNNLTLVGRALSAMLDMGTLMLVFLITKQVVKPKAQMANDKSEVSPYIAMFLYGAMVLPIQLSHFFTVDPYLTFFLTLSFFLLTSHLSLLTSIFLGLSMGLAIASKISALLFLPVIGIAFLQWFWGKRSLPLLILFSVLFFTATYTTVRLANPYLFASGNVLNPTLNPAVLANWKQLKSFDTPTSWFPPGAQWITTAPVVFPFMQLFFWGLGIPLGLLTMTALPYLISRVMHQMKKKSIDKQTIPMALLLLWIFLLFGYQSIQFAKPLRYFYPIFPFLAVSSGLFAGRFVGPVRSGIGNIGSIGLLVVFLSWPLSFLSIYQRPHTRIAASEWTYDYVPKGSSIAVEYWDDPLPLCLPNIPCGQYTLLSLPLYDPETPDKWQKINSILGKADYLILSSNRLYGSITSIPARFLQTNRYYQSLFHGSLGFTKIAQFTSRPTIKLPFLSLCVPVPGNSYGIIAKSIEQCTRQGISVIDDYAEESFTVYDHPTVTIWMNQKKLLAQ